MPVLSVRGHDVIILGESGDGPGRDGLFSDIEMAEAFDFSRGVSFRGRFFKSTNFKHFIIELFQEAIARAHLGHRIVLSPIHNFQEVFAFGLTCCIASGFFVMRAWQKAILGIFFFFVLLYSVGLFLDEETVLEKSLTVHAPVEAVFEQVNDLSQWSQWSPWNEKDPDMKVRFSTVTAGKGAWMKWDGPKVEKGMMVITESIPSEKIETALDFGRRGKAKGYWKFEKIQVKNKQATKVTWGFRGDANGSIMGKYFNLLLEPILGPELERGLERLKKLVEAPSS